MSDFIADVFDVVLQDADGDVIGTTTLQAADIEFSVQENDIRGGKGDQLLGVLHVSRDININLTDIAFRYGWLAKQLGQTIKTGAGVAFAMPEWYPVIDNAGTLEFELDETPDKPESVAIYDEGGNKLELNTDFTVTGKQVEITGVGIVAGDSVEVRTYTYATDPRTETILIDNSVFAKGVTAILETIEITGEEIPTAKLQYQFDRTVPTGNFSINTASERNAVATEFNLRVIKPKNTTVVGRVLRIPISA